MNLRIAGLLCLAVALLPNCKKNRPPDQPPAPTGPTATRVGGSAFFRATASDPDGQMVQVHLDWDNGDTSDWSQPFTSGDTARFVYAWPAPGNYKVSAQAIDEGNLTSLWSVWHEIDVADTVNRKPNAPRVTAGPDSAPVGLTCEFKVAGIDSNGDRIAYQFNWGNGDSSPWSALVGSGTEVTMLYAWPDTGFYVVTAWSRDEKGALSNPSAGHDIVIRDALP